MSFVSPLYLHFPEGSSLHDGVLTKNPQFKRTYNTYFPNINVQGLWHHALVYSWVRQMERAALYQNLFHASNILIQSPYTWRNHSLNGNTRKQRACSSVPEEPAGCGGLAPLHFASLLCSGGWVSIWLIQVGTPLHTWRSCRVMFMSAASVV